MLKLEVNGSVRSGPDSVVAVTRRLGTESDQTQGSAVRSGEMNLISLKGNPQIQSIT